MDFNGYTQEGKAENEKTVIENDNFLFGKKIENKEKIDEKVAQGNVLNISKENIKKEIENPVLNNKLHNNQNKSKTEVHETKSYWQKLKNVFTGKKSSDKGTQGNVKTERKTDAKVHGANSDIGRTLHKLRVAKPGQYSAAPSNGVEKENANQAKIVAMQNVSKEVQVHSDVYNAMETYAKITAIEELHGLSPDSGISFHGMDKSASMDVLKKASPQELQQALSSFKSNTDKNPIGNIDLSAKIVEIADKIPEQLSEQKESNGLSAKAPLSPVAQSLQDVFDNINKYKDANVYDSSETGQNIYSHKEKDFMSDMQKIVDIYKSNPNDSGVCDILKDNLSLLSQTAVSAASHQEVDQMSALMFEFGKELLGNSGISAENKAKVYEGLANMTNYEGENGRHYNPFTKSSQYKDSFAELMENANSCDKEMFYGKLTDKKLFEYNINYEKPQPQKQADIAFMKAFKTIESYN